MLIEILEKYPNTILYLKPKSKNYMINIIISRKLKRTDDNRVKVLEKTIMKK